MINQPFRDIPPFQETPIWDAISLKRTERWVPETPGPQNKWGPKHRVPLSMFNSIHAKGGFNTGDWIKMMEMTIWGSCTLGHHW